MFTPYLNPNPKTRQIAKQTTEEEAAARISFRLEELF